MKNKKIKMPRILSRAVREDKKVAAYTKEWLLRFQEILHMNAIEQRLFERRGEIVKLFPEHRAVDLADLDRALRYMRRKDSSRTKGGKSLLCEGWCAYVKESAHAAVDANLNMKGKSK